MENKKSEIKKEFGLIQKHPDDSLIRNFYSKSATIWIGSSYASNRSYNDIKEYYDSKLKEHGWEFYKEEKMFDWGKDYGGKSLRYRKGEFVATMQYAVVNADYGWDYGFSMSYGFKYD